MYRWTKNMLQKRTLPPLFLSSSFRVKYESKVAPELILCNFDCSIWEFGLNGRFGHYVISTYQEEGVNTDKLISHCSKCSAAHEPIWAKELSLQRNDNHYLLGGIILITLLTIDIERLSKHVACVPASLRRILYKTGCSHDPPQPRSSI